MNSSKIIELHQKYDIALEDAQRALNNLATGQAFLLGVSGKIASGKDTIAPLVMSQLGYSDYKHHFFAEELKKEMTQIVDAVKYSESLNEAVDSVEEILKPQAGPYRMVVETIYPLVKSGKVMDGYSRHPDFRKTIQYWGTNVRRAQDDNYWVRLLVAATIRDLAVGSAVAVTDGRFPNEVESVLAMGGELMRLNIQRSTQIERIVARDGQQPKKNSLDHPSEIALDGYSFDFAVAVDDKSPSTIAELAVRHFNGKKCD